MVLRCVFSLIAINFVVNIDQENLGGIASIPEDPLTQRLRGANSQDPNVKTLVRCFPLYSILLAIGNPTIDLFSLDIEGKK